MRLEIGDKSPLIVLNFPLKDDLRIKVWAWMSLKSGLWLWVIRDANTIIRGSIFRAGNSVESAYDIALKAWKEEATNAKG